MDEYKIWIKALDLDLECPVCLDIPLTSLLLCINGHHACLSCCKANALQVCPTCSEEFTETKNLFFDKFLKSLETLQVLIGDLIQKELQNVPETYLKDTSQHQKKKSIRCVSTQTDPFQGSLYSEQNNQPFNNNKKKIFYPCIVGECSQTLDYRSLIIHVKKQHSNTFTEVVLNPGKSIWRSFELSKENFSNIYDLSFFIVNMDLLLFLNIWIDTNGVLMARMALANSNRIVVLSCDLLVSCKNVTLHDHQILRSCKPDIRMISIRHFVFDKNKMFHIRKNNALTCELKITDTRGHHQEQ